MTVRIGDLALAAGVITPQRLHEAGASLAAQDRNEAGLEAARRAACLAPRGTWRSPTWGGSCVPRAASPRPGPGAKAEKEGARDGAAAGGAGSGVRGRATQRAIVTSLTPRGLPDPGRCLRR